MDIDGKRRVSRAERRISNDRSLSPEEGDVGGRADQVQVGRLDAAENEHNWLYALGTEKPIHVGNDVDKGKGYAATSVVAAWEVDLAMGRFAKVEPRTVACSYWD